jgi:hypothetical protein
MLSTQNNPDYVLFSHSLTIPLYNSTYVLNDIILIGKERLHYTGLMSWQESLLTMPIDQIPKKGVPDG